MEDFRFREFSEDDRAAAEELHSSCMEKQRASFSKDFNIKNLKDLKKNNETIAFSAESNNGDFAGYIWAVIIESSLYINTLEVKPEYRGLGIGKVLLENLMKKIDRTKVLRIFADLPVEAEGFSRVLLREGFYAGITRYCLDLND